jgi:hypothetical protein
MLTVLDAPADVLALRIEETITEGDLTQVLDRLEAALAAHDPLHLFVETHAISGVQLSALPSYAARAMPLFGKLRQFGRVAVVADQAWIRAGTRLESAILPFIAYRVFEPARRDEALAWVRSGTGAGSGAGD